ncbi:hypothetical protein EON62_04350 [archaeon]|nr:MAG: hypothetical protein EON62_04350 [archaeon]
MLDDFSGYLSRRDERYGVLRTFIADALEAGAVVYATGTCTFRVADRLVGGGSSDSSSSAVFQPRMLALTALEKADIADIVAAVFQRHPDIVKQVIAREDSARVPTAEEVGAAAQTLGRLIFQVAGGRARFVECATVALFSGTDAWCIHDHGMIAMIVLATLQAAFPSVEKDLSVRRHLKLCLGDEEPSEALVVTFRRHLFEMLVFGALRPANTRVGEWQLHQLLHGYFVPFTRIKRGVSMFAGDVIMQAFMK